MIQRTNIGVGYRLRKGIRHTLLTAAAIGWTVLLASVPAALAAPDQYPGDSAIYGVQAPLQPNVLVIIDDSGSMGDSVLAADYNPAATYAAWRCSFRLWA